MQTAQERLYLTKEKDRLVAANDKRAAFLYAAEGDEIPDDAAERFGLVEGRLKGSAGKEAKPAANKEKKTPPENKGQQG